MTEYDAVVVGAGPNGLAAAIELARTGRRVLVREAERVVGGAARSEPLTRDGFLHDTFSAVHPMAVSSPFLRSLTLETHGLTWVHSPAALAHPLDGGRAVLLEGTVAETAAALGQDRAAYRKTLEPLAEAFHRLMPMVLAPMARLPRHPLLQARFGFLAIRSADSLVGRFRGADTRALFAGSAGHSGLSLATAGSSGVALVLSLAGHAVGWPIPRGGAGRIGPALASVLRSLGGQIETDAPVTALSDLPSSRATLLDLTPRQVLSMLGDRLPARYRRKLLRYRYGPAAFKVDWALREPIPWQATECRRAATVHVGGSYEDVAASEAAVAAGGVSESPFVILAQPSLFDPTRAPEGRHTAWGYCHVPAGFDQDVTDRLEAQIERFAPGFRDVILDRSVLSPRDLERRNPNLVGGDIAGGSMDLRQLLCRPASAFEPYRTPLPGVFLCSSSTPPGGGVHGMCGFHAARSVIRAGL